MERLHHSAGQGTPQRLEGLLLQYSLRCRPGLKNHSSTLQPLRTLPVERSVSPHDVYDWWIEKYGRTLDAFWPVADTKIGRLGIMMAMEGNYPENGRGLAMNGAEVVYRASMPAPFTENDVFEISNRARALENNMYIVAPNIGSYHLDVDHPVGIDAGGGQSMIVDYRGQLVGKQRDTNGSTFVAGVINIEALRHHRERSEERR